MKPRPPLPGGPYLVLGLARSGLAAASTLNRLGEAVIGWDGGSVRDPRLATSIERLSMAGVELHLDPSAEGLLDRVQTVIKSPGIPSGNPAVEAARARGMPVLGEVEMAWRLTPNEFVAVTGTNGKTTTTEWIGHIHRTAGAPAVVAGNVGTALSSYAGLLVSGTTVICEVSSFQLEDSIEFAPEVAVLLNLTPDHLDRHGSLESYGAAKMRIFARQDESGVAVLPDDFEQEIPGSARQERFGSRAAAALGLSGGELSWHGTRLLSASEVSLPGPHNLQNAMAAAAACLVRGLDRGAVAEGLRTFRGVPHRLELIAEIDGVSYVNDSKATNIGSTLVALRAYAAGVHLIAGGQGKGQDFSELSEEVSAHCRALYLIGEDARAIATALRPLARQVPLHRCVTLEQAFLQARAAARPGEVVLLSPACASFDQFRDFEARGDRFRELVLEAADRRGRR